MFCENAVRWKMWKLAFWFLNYCGKTMPEVLTMRGKTKTAINWDYQVGGQLLRLTFQSDSNSESNGFENSIWALTLINCYLVLRYLENNTELENSLKDIQMPSKKLGSITVGGYSKFNNVLLFFPTLPSPSRSSVKRVSQKRWV